MKVKDLKEFLNQSWVKDDMTVSIFENSMYLPVREIRYNAMNILLFK